VPFELAEGYHVAAPQLSRFGNIAEKTRGDWNDSRLTRMP
jgi:hypothetical protein